MNVITTENIPIKMWLDDMEEGALAQAKNLANLPFAFKHIAIMPDSHQGYGMPIGGVLATKGVIVPNAVGVDIGCGMCALKTSLTDIDPNKLGKIVHKAQRMIPVGFTHHDKAQSMNYMPDNSVLAGGVVDSEFKHARTQIGTLGGGNHFIEIQKGDDGHIWIMIHSGSRNLGFKTARHYNKLAISLNEKWHSSIPTNWELAFLPLDSDEARDYRDDMDYCVAFALANRILMMNRVLEAMNDVVDARIEGEVINKPHNFAVFENHFKQNVMVHRKGSTRAYKGEYGIIPGSQGTKSYIVKGLGEPMSFKSCSHGAGRVMGRKQAKRELDLKHEQSLMKGIIHNIVSDDQLDEAPSAYKDIDIVMENQKDLAKIEVELTPLAVIKG